MNFTPRNILKKVYKAFSARPTTYDFRTRIEKFFILELFFAINLNLTFKKISIYFLDLSKRTFGDGFIYVRGLGIIFFIDACLTDDEPL